MQHETVFSYKFKVTFIVIYCNSQVTKLDIQLLDLSLCICEKWTCMNVSLKSYVGRNIKRKEEQVLHLVHGNILSMIQHALINCSQ